MKSRHHLAQSRTFVDGTGQFGEKKKKKRYNRKKMFVHMNKHGERDVCLEIYLHLEPFQLS